MNRFLLPLAAIFIAVFNAIALPAAAQQAAPQAIPKAPVITGKLFSPVPTVNQGPSVPVGLQIALPEGWHTYWRTPGIAGAPPQLNWAGSQNFASAQIIWPAPQRFSVEGLESYGYEGSFVLPIMVRLAQPGEPVDLKLEVTLIVCREICVPAKLQTGLVLPNESDGRFVDAAAYQDAFRRVPRPAAEQHVTIGTVTLLGSTALQVNATREAGWRNPDIFIEAQDDSVGQIVFKKPDLQIKDQGQTATFTVPLDDPQAAPLLAGKTITLTIIDGDFAVDARQPVTGGATTSTAADAAADAAASPGANPNAADTDELPAEVGQPRTLLSYILLALLGGLVLNLMPCVLPVLSLKLLSVVQHAGETRARIRRGFIATSLGILTSFLLLAGATIALQAAGGTLAHYAGWGVQFQQPLFLGFLLAIVLGFTANMFGWFEIALPGAVQNRLGGPQLPGEADAPSILGEFLSGFLATLLATPCTAPFVGSAVGFALTTGPLGIVAIFVALGLGLAAPYLLIALFPELARMLPRPGRWMLTLRAVLGLFLLLTALWLLGLLVIQLGWQGGLAVFALGALLLLALRRRKFLIGAILGLLLIGAAGLLKPAPMTMDRETLTADLAWQPFEPDRIPELVAQGKTVFVDLTASWCLTCHVNDRLVLDTDEIRSTLSQPDVYLMRGDWTRPNPMIGDYLKAHGRAGIPFNMVVSPGAPEGVILPELLNKAVVMDAIGRTED